MLTADDLTPDELAALGRIAVDSARLEYLIERALWRAMNLSQAAGAHKTKGFESSKQTNMLKRKLLAEKGADRDAITGMCKAIKDALIERNKIIHGIVFEHQVPAFDDGTSFSDGTSWVDHYSKRVKDRHGQEGALESQGSSRPRGRIVGCRAYCVGTGRRLYVSRQVCGGPLGRFHQISF